MNPKRLSALQEVARIRQELELAALAHHLRQDARLAEARRILSDEARQAATVALEDLGAAGAFERFRAVLDLRQATLAAEQARLDAELAQQRGLAQTAFGRAQALAALARRQGAKRRT